MSILSEKALLDIKRLAKRQHVSESEMKEFFKSFEVVTIPKIPTSELTFSEKAEDISYDALYKIEIHGANSKDIETYYKQGKAALDLDPECIPAFEVCASTATSQKRRDKYLFEGVAVGNKKYGGTFEKKNMGRFWILVEPRSFLRLLAFTANYFTEAKDFERAISLYERIVKFDATDSMYCRYPLQNLYMATGALEKFFHMYGKTKDRDSIHYLFNYALYLYITEGETEASNQAMQSAIKCNQYVLPYIRGKKKLKAGDVAVQEYIQNEESGARVYCGETLSTWHSQFGIQRWLKIFDGFKP